MRLSTHGERKCIFRNGGRQLIIKFDSSTEHFLHIYQHNCILNVPALSVYYQYLSIPESPCPLVRPCLHCASFSIRELLLAPCTLWRRMSESLKKWLPLSRACLALRFLRLRPAGYCSKFCWVLFIFWAVLSDTGSQAEIKIQSRLTSATTTTNFKVKVTLPESVREWK